jgi:hypothetical protein
MKHATCVACGLVFVRRSDVSSADETASRGRGNFRAAARKLSVTENDPGALLILEAILAKSQK